MMMMMNISKVLKILFITTIIPLKQGVTQQRLFLTSAKDRIPETKLGETDILL